MQVEWLRDEGQHGGGVRYQKIDTELFNRVTVNVSGVHYEDKVRRGAARRGAALSVGVARAQPTPFARRRAAAGRSAGC